MSRVFVQHPEPWRVSKKGNVVDANGRVIFWLHHKTDARLICTAICGTCTKDLANSLPWSTSLRGYIYNKEGECIGRHQWKTLVELVTRRANKWSPA